MKPYEAGNSPAMHVLSCWRAGSGLKNPFQEFYTAPEVRDWFLESAKEAPAWQNVVTLRTLEYWSKRGMSRESISLTSVLRRCS